jgi:predicted RNA-binding Zn-ribbon protein involved in translation (DUF1610 family)
MLAILDCPSCGRKLRLPEDLLGKRVKCPTCGGEFDATPPADGAKPNLSLDDPAAPPAGGPASPVTSAAPGSSPPPPREEGSTRYCPACGERVPAGSERCHYCGADLTAAHEDDRPWERPGGPARRDSEPHRGTLILVLGILSLVIGYIGLPMGIMAWVMGQRDLRKMAANEMDPQGKGLTQAGWICGIIGTILQSLYVVCCVGYFGFVIFFVSQGAATAPPAPRPAAPAPPAPPRPVPPPQRPKKLTRNNLLTGAPATGSALPGIAGEHPHGGPHPCHPATTC